jgi:hypothetical protein
MSDHKPQIWPGLEVGHDCTGDCGWEETEPDEEEVES